jgi:hypothetical protein
MCVRHFVNIVNESAQRIRLTACYSVATNFSYEEIPDDGSVCSSYVCEQKMVAVNDIGMCAWVVGNVMGLEESFSVQSDHSICVFGIKMG